MKSLASQLIAMVQLTWQEAARAKLWWLAVVGMAALLAVIPQLGAVDQGDRLKLAVSFTTSLSGFLIILLGVLVTGGFLCRDRERRLLATLWSKPLSRAVYVVGRCLGVWLLSLCLSLCLSLAAIAAIWWQLGNLPQPQQVISANDWYIEEYQQQLPVPSNRSRLRVSGDPRTGAGAAVLWQFNTHSSASSSAVDGDLRLLLRTRLSSGAVPPSWGRVLVSAAPSLAGPWTPLELEVQSPYGQLDDQLADRALPGEVRLRSRRSSHSDVQQDYARLHIPAKLIAANQLAVRVQRLDPEISQVWEKDDGALLAYAGGSFATNLAKSQGILLARVLVVICFAALFAGLSQLGVVLLASLTVYLGGSALGFIGSSLAGQAEGPGQRLFQLVLKGIPDFNRYAVEAPLATSRAIELGTVGAAWGYYGMFALIVGGCALVVWGRSEL